MKNSLKRVTVWAIALPVSAVFIALLWYTASFITSGTRADNKAFLRSYSQVAASFFQARLNRSSEVVIALSKLARDALSEGTESADIVKSILADGAYSAAWLHYSPDYEKHELGALFYSAYDDYGILNIGETDMGDRAISRELELLSSKTYTSVTIALTVSPALNPDTQVFRITAPLYLEGTIIGMCGIEFPINKLILDFKQLYPDVLSRIAIAYSRLDGNGKSVYQTVRPTYGDGVLIVEVELLGGAENYGGIEIGPLFIAITAAWALITAVIVIAAHRLISPLGKITGAVEELSNGGADCPIPDMGGKNSDYVLLANSTAKLKALFSEFRSYDSLAKKLHAQYSKLMEYIQSASAEDSGFDELARSAMTILDYRKATVVTRRGNKINVQAAVDAAAPVNSARLVYSQPYGRVFSVLKDKEIYCCNKFVLSRLHADLAAPDTVSACALPLRNAKGELFGCVFLESPFFVTVGGETEKLFINTAKALSGIAVRKITDANRQAALKPVKQEDAPSHKDLPDSGGGSELAADFSQCRDLDVPLGLSNAGGDNGKYIQNLRSLAERLPQAAANLANLRNRADLSAYSDEICHLKDDFNAVGAAIPAGIATALENAARNGDRAYCEINGSGFNELIGGFVMNLNVALQKRDEKTSTTRDGGTV